MKKLLALLVISTIGLVSCSKDNLTAGPETKPGKPSAPAAAIEKVNLDGTWKTKCLNGTVQTHSLSYTGETVIKGSELYQKWTSFTDQECTKGASENFTPKFVFAIGEESGAKTITLTWDKTVVEADGLPHHYTGKHVSPLETTEKSLKFIPAYDETQQVEEYFRE